MQSVSDNNVPKRLLEKPRFELAAKGVFRLVATISVPVVHSNNYRCEVIFPRTAKCPGKGVWVLIRYLVLLDGNDLAWSVIHQYTWNENIIPKFTPFI